MTVVTTGTKWYLGGPMTGLPQFNFPAFFAAAEELRAMGYQIVSPAELDDPETTKAALTSPDGAPGTGNTNGETWGDFLARDVRLIADGVDGVIVMTGWHKSRGARLETFVAYICGKPIVYYPSLRSVPKKKLAKAWLGVLFNE